jgi:two-component system, sensor histidine kinase
MHNTSTTGTGVPRVLVVDDHVDGATALGKFLEMLGCEVRAVYSGKAAIETAPEFQPQLVILDIEMPGLDGWGTARQLRAQSWAKAAVFASHSGATEPTIVQMSRDAGFDHHVSKTRSIEAFEQIVRTLKASGG